MKKWGLILGVVLVVGLLIARSLYQRIFGVVESRTSGSIELFVPSESKYEDLVEGLIRSGALMNRDDFDWVTEKKDFHDAVKPGRYVIEEGITMNDLVNKLRAGDQDPVKMVVSEVRTIESLAGKMSTSVEVDSLTIYQYLSSPEVWSKYGFDEQTFPSLFIPNSYEVWWTDDAEILTARMASEYKKFWNEERKAKAAGFGLSQSEVSTLASIVKAETNNMQEAPDVAGVYLNRIRIGMPLQADPTLVFALGDFSIQRVLDRHKEIKSPYNTYKNLGLPPGPINIPNSGYIDAVLNAPRHKFLYFCASPDMDGTHDFAKTYSQHLNNANKYQRALNQRGIYR
ncbi:MAG: UPF0755 protein [Flavobacteriales bacterium]|jgi:UPF0755 protein